MSVQASLNELKAQGWGVASGISERSTWSASSQIVVTKDGYYLRHSYSVREDDSDWSGDDSAVVWEPVEIYEEVRRYPRHLPENTPVPFDVTRRDDQRREARAQREREEKQRREAKDRAEFERLKQRFGGE